MSDDAIQLIAAAAIAVCQIYAMEPWKFPIFAKFWDFMARLCGNLANMLGWWSMKARENYYTAIAEIS
jgi:hypothetical protein